MKTDSQEARDWLTDHLSKIRSGGMWCIPRSNAIYRIDHENKTMHRVVGCDVATERVAKAIGWRIEER
jgi:hypothetical protein